MDDVGVFGVPRVVEHDIGDGTATDGTVPSTRPADDEVSGDEPVVRR
jgi:hypothetical protein